MSGYTHAAIRCGCCEKPGSRPKIRPRPKHKDRARVLDLVRNKVLAIIKSSKPGWFRAETMATDLDADLAAVKWSLHRMNLEGLVGRPRHRILHDSNRDPWNGGSHTGWCGNVYDVIRPLDASAEA